MERTLPYINSMKKVQIRTMFFTLKMLSLIFSVIPILQYFSNKYKLSFMNYNFYTFGITLIICMLMIFLILVFYRNVNNRALQILEMFIFISVITTVIYISGASKSYNKYMFLFIIICYTIENGLKTGLAIASVSTGVIVLADILFNGDGTINYLLESDLALIAMYYFVAWTLGYYVKLEKLHIQNIVDYANMDGLTGVYNHRYFYETIETLCENNKNKNSQLSLLMIDIDYFKKYNDIHGHSQGDELLKEITAIMINHLKEKDILCRYGGDEFCAILPDTSKEEACRIANHLREAVYHYDCFGQEYMDNGRITLSIGVSSYNKETEGYKDLIDNADMALYRAKFLRRNKVEVYSSVFDHMRERDNVDANLLEDIKPLKTLITVINSRDTYTYKHVERVYNYCTIMADYLKLSEEDKRSLLYAAYLHDLGKINISKEILITNKKLTMEEWEELKKHPQDSADILKQINGFEKVVPVVLQHHEKYDGSGYPNRLKGEQINYLARILTVADSFDAMTNQRTYQKTKTFKEAFEEIERCKGTHFDPVIADQFIDAIQSL